METDLRTFVGLWVGTVVSPRVTLASVPDRSIRYGIASVVLYSVLYVLVAIALVRNQLEPVFPPVLPIAEDQYYLWQVGFTLPVVLLGWVLLGTIGWALARRLFGGRGSLRAYLNVLAFAFYVPQLLVVWPPELVAATVHPEWWGRLDAVPIPILFDEIALFPVYIWLGLGWSFVLTTIAIVTVSRTSRSASVVTAALSMSLTMAFYVLFIR